jgi:hypothetical protein
MREGWMEETMRLLMGMPQMEGEVDVRERERAGEGGRGEDGRRDELKGG